MSYLENYKHPKWQKKRLEILERDEFTYQSCHETEKTLNVHHCVPYKKGVMPWEYENDELITFCQDCHKTISEIIDECVSVIMGRCWSIDSSGEMNKILSQLDGLNPPKLRLIAEISEIINKY